MSTRPSAPTPWKGTSMCRRNVSAPTAGWDALTALGRYCFWRCVHTVFPPPSDMFCFLCAAFPQGSVVGSSFLPGVALFLKLCLPVLVQPSPNTWALGTCYTSHLLECLSFGGFYFQLRVIMAQALFLFFSSPLIPILGFYGK